MFWSHVVYGGRSVSVRREHPPGNVAGRGITSVERAELAELRAALDREQARADQLKASVKAARRIGMAIGVLMGRNALGEHEAFLALEAEGMRSGRKLHDAAEAVLMHNPVGRARLGRG